MADLGVRAIFDAAAESIPPPLDWSSPITLAALAASKPNEATRLVLDVGCGAAQAYRGPTGLGLTVTVVLGDLSFGVLRHVRVPGSPLVQLDGMALPFAAGAFDRIICSLTLGFSSDPVAVLAEFARVLADGGCAVVAELSRQRDPSLAFTQRLLAEELANARVPGRLRTPLPPLRRIAAPAGLAVTAIGEEFFSTEITSSDECCNWFYSTHRTVLARLERDRVDRLRETIASAAGDALSVGPLRSEQGVTLTVLESASGGPR